jgi:hypothetical protein
MKPTFFSFERPFHKLAGRVWSGWQHNTGEFWATPTVAAEIGVDHLPVIRDMVKVSDAVHLKPALTWAARIELVRDVDLKPYATLRAGERGVVGRTDGPLGEASVFLEHYHPGLEETANCAWFIPHYTDDILDAVRVIPEVQQLPCAVLQMQSQRTKNKRPRAEQLARIAATLLGGFSLLGCELFEQVGECYLWTVENVVHTTLA